MKVCPKCNNQVEDSAVFCNLCGAPLDPAAAQQAYGAGYVPYNPYDHTAEYDPQDISSNKVFAMLIYLSSFIGILIALLAANQSPYVMYHLRQALKFMVVEILTGLICVILLWTVIIPIAAGIFLVVLEVIKIICFFQVCSGKAKDAAIIRSMGFLK